VALSEAAVGVDIERMRPLDRVERVAVAALSADELEAWRDSSGDRAERFLRLWTRKEALLKAIGTGLRESPRQVIFDEHGRLIGAPTAAGDIAAWAVGDVETGDPLLVASVAVCRPGATLRIEASTPVIR